MTVAGLLPLHSWGVVACLHSLVRKYSSNQDIASRKSWHSLLIAQPEGESHRKCWKHMLLSLSLNLCRSIAAWAKEANKKDSDRKKSAAPSKTGDSWTQMNAAHSHISSAHQQTAYAQGPVKWLFQCCRGVLKFVTNYLYWCQLIISWYSDFKHVVSCLSGVTSGARFSVQRNRVWRWMP